MGESNNEIRLRLFIQNLRDGMSPLLHLYWWCWTLLVVSLAGLPLSLTAMDRTVPAPDFVEQIDNVTVAQGRDAILSCTVSHLNDYTVGWVKVDTKAIQATGLRVVTLNTRVSVENIPGSPVWKLIIKSVQPDDAGYYMAQINTDPMKSQMAYLSVMEPPNIDDEATPSVWQVREHESVELYCQASGQPIPNIVWKREDGTNVNHDLCRHANDMQRRQNDGPSVRSLPMGYGRLCIASTNRSSMGIYLCIASNGVLPSVSKRIQLVVLFPTTIRAEKPLVGAPAGVTGVDLECIVEASPLSNHLFWYFTNSSIGPSERHSMTIQKINAFTIKMTLTILKLMEGDAGVYRCQAGRSEATIRLYIHTPITGSARSTTNWMLETGTAPWREKQPGTSAAHLAIIQSPVITTETYRSVTFGQHTLSHAEVLANSNRPVQGVVYKNFSGQSSRSCSSMAFHLGQYCSIGQLVLVSLVNTIFTQVLRPVLY